jgi:hypothetical protein
MVTFDWKCIDKNFNVLPNDNNCDKKFDFFLLLERLANNTHYAGSGMVCFWELQYL